VGDGDFPAKRTTKRRITLMAALIFIIISLSQNIPYLCPVVSQP
jgi:hypothetical protein